MPETHRDVLSVVSQLYFGALKWDILKQKDFRVGNKPTGIHWETQPFFSGTYYPIWPEKHYYQEHHLAYHFLPCIRFNPHFESFTQQSTVLRGKKYPKLYVKPLTAQGNWWVRPLQKNFILSCGQSVLEWKQLYPTAVGCFLPVTSVQLLCKLCSSWRDRFILDVIEGQISIPALSTSLNHH